MPIKPLLNRNEKNISDGFHTLETPIQPPTASK